MDAANLEFKDNSFDTVISYNGLGHLKGFEEKVITEMKRVVKPDGNVILIAT